MPITSKMTSRTGANTGPAHGVPVANGVIQEFNAIVPTAKLPLATIISGNSDEAYNKIILAVNASLAALGGTAFIPSVIRTTPAETLDTVNKLVLRINAALASVP